MAEEQSLAISRWGVVDAARGELIELVMWRTGNVSSAAETLRPPPSGHRECSG